MSGIFNACHEPLKIGFWNSVWKTSSKRCQAGPSFSHVDVY